MSGAVVEPLVMTPDVEFEAVDWPPLAPLLPLLKMSTLDWNI